MVFRMSARPTTMKRLAIGVALSLAAAVLPAAAQNQPAQNQPAQNKQPPAQQQVPATQSPAPQSPAPQSPAAESTAAPSMPQQGGKLRSQHGAWSILCDTPAGAKNEQCALIQNVVAAKRPELGLSVVVLKTADHKARILRVLAPLGVLLPNGLGLNVDSKDIGRAYFVRCFEDGCYAEVILEDSLIKTLRNGKTATFVVFQTPEEGVGIPVDLKGFGEGFDALP